MSAQGFPDSQTTFGGMQCTLVVLSVASQGSLQFGFLKSSISMGRFGCK